MKLNKTRILVCLLYLWSGIAQAAKVNAVSVPKQMVSLTLDPTEVFNARDKLCLIGQNQAKLACGMVVKVKAGAKLIVKIAKSEDLTKLKKGTAVNLRKLPGSKNGAASNDAGSVASVGGKSPFRLALNYDAAMIMPASYNQVSYAPPQESPPPNVLTPDAVVSSQFLPFDGKLKLKYVGIVGEVGVPIGTKSLSLGVRYQAFQASSVESDYDTGLQDPYVKTLTTATAFGVWTDFVFLRKPAGKSLSLNVFGGAGFDQYTVTVRATKLTSPENAAPASDGAGANPTLYLVDPTPEGASMITGTAKLGFISLRAGAKADFQLSSHFGLSAGATAVIPLIAPLSSASVDVAEGEDRGVADSQTDFKNAVKLTKKSFGLDVLLGAYASF